MTLLLTLTGGDSSLCYASQGRLEQGGGVIASLCCSSPREEEKSSPRLVMSLSPAQGLGMRSHRLVMMRLLPWV